MATKREKKEAELKKEKRDQELESLFELKRKKAKITKKIKRLMDDLKENNYE